MRLRDFQPSIPHQSHESQDWWCLNSISEHYFSGWWPAKVLTAETVKLVVELSDGTEKFRQKEEYQQLINVARVQTHFDFDSYCTANVLDKKKMLLTAMHDGCLRACEIKGWDETPFQVAKDKVIAENYDYWVFGKLHSRADRKFKTQLIMHYGWDKTEFIAVLFDKNGKELERQTIHQMKPSGLLSDQLLGKFGWLDLQTAYLQARNGNQVCEVIFASLHPA